MNLRLMREVLDIIEADVKSRPSPAEFEMAYQARFANHQGLRIKQGLANLFAAGNFTNTGAASVVLQDHDIAHKEWTMRSTEV